MHGICEEQDAGVGELAARSSASRTTRYFSIAVLFHLRVVHQPYPQETGDRFTRQLKIDGPLEADARALEARIRERIAAGLIPDLRRAVKCDYFYKSFWRDPHYIDLSLREVAYILLDLLG